MQSKTSYHHGNLKHALIEAGIEIVNESGEAGLSLRKTAARCGVSSAAPYSHFASKEDMIEAMQDYVTEKFMEYLKEAVRACEAPYTDEGIVCFGRSYIRFFLENPNYFTFLFSQSCMKINLSASCTQTDNFAPYEYFRQIILEYNQRNHKELSADEQELQIIRLWATAHGIASVATMKNVTWDKKWEEQLEQLLY